MESLPVNYQAFLNEFLKLCRTYEVGMQGDFSLVSKNKIYTNICWNEKLKIWQGEFVGFQEAKFNG